ncbi:MAG: hypothetical protein ACK559_03685, partial [bacterium]
MFACDVNSDENGAITISGDGEGSYVGVPGGAAIGGVTDGGLATVGEVGVTGDDGQREQLALRSGDGEEGSVGGLVVVTTGDGESGAIIIKRPVGIGDGVAVIDGGITIGIDGDDEARA